jgi:hypothetical protein
MRTEGCRFIDLAGISEALRNLQLCYAHAVYLEAICFAVESGIGSRGSCMVLDSNGTPAHESLGDKWRFATENPLYREKVLETVVRKEGEVENQWVNRRPLPRTEAWFETTWADFRDGKIYGD